MLQIKKNDTVYVIAGKDRGKKGKVLKVLSERKRAIVEGINIVSKHRRRTREDQQGGIAHIESPIHISNLMLFCRHCNRPKRFKTNTLKDGSKVRVCGKCKEEI